MFPQLVAGPIVRARDILDQMGSLKLQKGDELYFAIKLIIYGFFKKMVIADGLAKYVNTAFVSPEYAESSLYWWSISICFAIQIYCDFSGYSDIARGLARMYGIHFPLNFNHPYVARSFKDFWGRWHMSLSSWFKDYVYIPLGGSRKGRLRSHINMWITMIVSGVWHGANYTFIMWGALHALFLSIERELDFVGSKWRVPVFFKRVIVLAGVLIAWVYFRAESFTQANSIVYKMITFKGASVSLGNTLTLIILTFVLREVYVGRNLVNSKLRKYIHPFEPFWVGALAILSIFLRGDGDTFIYFQF
jgi:alginate O-acetyltransferase complex protein AlgI